MNNNKISKPKHKWIIVKIVASLAVIWLLSLILLPLLPAILGK